MNTTIRHVTSTPMMPRNATGPTPLSSIGSGCTK